MIRGQRFSLSRLAVDFGPDVEKAERQVAGTGSLEPISKLFQEHRDAGDLHKPEEVGRVILPTNQYASFPLQPGKEAFDKPAALVPPQVTPILGLEFAGGTVWGDQIVPIVFDGRHRVHRCHTRDHR